MHRVSNEFPRNPPRPLPSPQRKRVHGVVGGRGWIRDEASLRFRASISKATCICLRSEKKEEEGEGETGRRRRGQVELSVLRLQIEEWGGPAVAVLENSCNDSRTGLICVRSGSKREKGEEKEKRRTLTLTVQLEVVPCSFEWYC